MLGVLCWKAFLWLWRADWNSVPCIAGWILNHWAARESNSASFYPLTISCSRFLILNPGCVFRVQSSKFPQRSGLPHCPSWRDIGSCRQPCWRFFPGGPRTVQGHVPPPGASVFLCIQTLVLFARLLPLPLHFFPVWLEPRAVWPLSSNLLHKLTLLSVLQRGNSPNAEISWFLPLGTPVFKKKKLEIAEREQKHLSTFPPQCWLPSVSFWPAKAL